MMIVKNLISGTFSSIVTKQIIMKPDNYQFKLLGVLHRLPMCERCQQIYNTPPCFKKRLTKEEKKNKKGPHLQPSALKSMAVVEVWKNMTIQELATSMEKDCDYVFEALTYIDNSAHFNKPNSVINNWEVLVEVIKKCGLRYKLVIPPHEENDDTTKEFQDITIRPSAPEDQLKPRPPVVTIMGHVDHGKTTLLDTLRDSSVVNSEFGGITQHIGAFSVVLKSGERITMLDTPGHAAFSAMRARGANATDIVVLVVAADDGVMQQTVESIRMANEAKVPIIVAINKIDKREADIERTKRMLSKMGVIVEDQGGDIQSVPISALKGTNVDELVEAIVLQAEIMELKADYTGFVEGTIIESSTDQTRGKLATVLVTRGTLRRGSVVVAGHAWARVRSLFDEDQRVLQQVTPGLPAQVIGWRELPSAGDLLLEVESEKKAQQVVKFREAARMKAKALEDLPVIESKMAVHNEMYKAQLEKRRAMGKRRRLKPSGLREKENEENNKELRVSIVIKGDVDGSVEAILDVLETYSSPLCKLDLVHYGVGSVTLTDVEMADAAKAIIYTFNIGLLKEAEDKVNQRGITVKRHNVIYKLFDDLKSEIEKILPPIQEEDVLGEAEVLEQFLITEGRKKIPVAGCRCVKGALKKKATYRVMRNEEVVFEGKLESMKHLKDEVDQIKSGSECGLRLLDPTVKFQRGDKIICYVLKPRAQVIDWQFGF